MAGERGESAGMPANGSLPPRHPLNLRLVWVASVVVSVVVAAAGKLYEHWSDCNFLPGQGDCELRLLYVKLYGYVAGLVIFVGMTIYVLAAARKRKRGRQS